MEETTPVLQSATLQSIFLTLAEEAGKLGEVTLPQEVFDGIISHFDGVKVTLTSLPSFLVAGKTVEEANKLAFEGSKEFQELKLTLKEMGREEVPPATYERLFKGFKKPYSDEKPPQAPELKFSASFSLGEAGKRQGGGRGSRGQGENPDPKWLDMLHTDRASTVYYNVIWRAYKSDGPLKDSMTEAEEKASQFYAQGSHGTKFVERMVAQGRIAKDAQRGYMSNWAKEQKLPDGSPRFVEEKD